MFLFQFYTFGYRKIYPKLKEWQDQVKMVIIEGAGEKAFCAGGDIRAITDSKGSPSQGDFFREEYQARYGHQNEVRN